MEISQYEFDIARRAHLKRIEGAARTLEQAKCLFPIGTYVVIIHTHSSLLEKYKLSHLHVFQIGSHNDDDYGTRYIKLRGYPEHQYRIEWLAPVNVPLSSIISELLAGSISEADVAVLFRNRTYEIPLPIKGLPQDSPVVSPGHVPQF